jgi:hypothetical protein
MFNEHDELELSRQWIIYFERLGKPADEYDHHTPAIFNISGTETGPALDPGPRRPIRSYENGFVIKRMFVDCPIVGSAAVVDILHSDDGGDTWQSIFSAEEFAIHLAAGSNVQAELDAFREGLVLATDELLRQDVLSGVVTNLATSIELAAPPTGSGGVAAMVQPQNSAMEALI